MAVKSNSDTLVTVFGGSGFLGRHVVRALANRNYLIRVAVRRPELAGYLQPLGRVGQIHAVQANVRFARRSKRRCATPTSSSISSAFCLNGAASASMPCRPKARERWPRPRAPPARGSSTSRLSAPTRIRTRTMRAPRPQASGWCWRRNPQAIIMRPSIVFGPEDDFFNRLAALARIAPALPLPGGGHTRFQPVFAGDVAEAIARAVDGKVKSGTVYEFGGPDVPHLQGTDGIHACHRRTPPPAAADPVRGD